MPKMKTHSGAKKRFKKTAQGKWRHARAGAQAPAGPHDLRSPAIPQRQGDAPQNGGEDS